MQHPSHHEAHGDILSEWIPLLMVAAVAVVYLCAALSVTKQRSNWSGWRTSSFFAWRLLTRCVHAAVSHAVGASGPARAHGATPADWHVRTAVPCVGSTRHLGTESPAGESGTGCHCGTEKQGVSFLEPSGRGISVEHRRHVRALPDPALYPKPFQSAPALPDTWAFPGSGLPFHLVNGRS